MAIDFPPNPEVGQTHETAGTVYTWTGDRWTARSYELQYPVPIYTNMVLTTPRDPDPELAGVVAAEPEILETQEQVNDLLADAAKAIAKNAERVADAVDFSQNTIGKGYWTHQIPPNEVELYPRPGEFWTDDNETDFGQITKFKFNDTGLPGNNDPGSLEGTKIGDYLLVQCNGTNDFGYYVVTSLEIETVGNQIFRTFGVKLFRDARFKGASTEGVRHTVSTLRPVYTIVADEQPVVSTRGLLWYRESDDHLFISNYGDGFVGDGPQWTDLTAGGGGGDYLPLTGGTMKGDVSMGGHKITALGSPVQPGQAANKGYIDDNFLSLKGGTVAGPLSVNELLGVKDDVVEYYKHRTSITQMGPKEIINVGILDNLMRDPGQYGYLQAYLPLAGGAMTGALEIKRDSGTSLIVRKGESLKFDVQAGGKIRCFYDLSLDDEDTTVVTRGFVKEQLASVGGGGLSLRDKMYLQGFYPWKVAEGSQASNPGDFLPKKSDYNVDLNPETWSYLYFSVVDAYGQDLAGTFMNHMEMNKPRELQLWIARENGTKICTFMGKMRCRDQNFEERFTVDLDVSDKDLVVSPHWDSASLEISRGEILWIKCSAWGN